MTTRSATCRPASSPGRSRPLARSTPNWSRRLAAKTDPRVKQDLEILVKAAADMIKGTELRRAAQVPYFSLDKLIFASFRGLLDDQIAASRRPAALVRLRKYTGLEPGTKPIVEHAMAYVRERMNNPRLTGTDQVEDPERPRPGRVLRAGIGKLFEKFKIRATSPPIKSSRNSSPPGTSSSSRKYCPRPAKTSGCRLSSMRSTSNRSASTFRRPSLPPGPTKPSPRSRARCKTSRPRSPRTRGCHPPTIAT